MDYTDDIKPISYVKSHAADVLKRVNETHNPMVITQNGEAKAVVLDPRSYKEMRDSLSLLKLLAMGEKDIKEGKIISHDDLFLELEEEYGF